MSYRPPSRIFTILLVFSAALCVAAEKKLPVGETSNELLDISASQPLDQDEIRQELGMDLGDNDIVVVRLTARPVSDKPVQLSLDDFLMISSKDGQRSEPFEAGQLAGSDSLAVTQDGMRKSGLGNNPHRPTFSVGGFGGGIGTGEAPQAPNVKMEESRAAKENPLLTAVKAKILPEKEIKDPVTGLLFFQITGKVKAKDLELRYKGPGGAMALRFKPDK